MTVLNWVAAPSLRPEHYEGTSNPHINVMSNGTDSSETQSLIDNSVNSVNNVLITSDITKWSVRAGDRES